MSSLREVIAESRKLVMPTLHDERRMKRLAERMLSRVKNAASAFPEVRGALVGGSFAKGTWLPRGVDLDIFVRIDREVKEDRFEAVGLAVGRKAVEGYPQGKKYAQHPYTEAVVDRVKVNVVPCYDVEPGHWKSAADRSPYHVSFVKESLGKGAKTQVRVLKRFMKTVRVYGAEIEHEGFSGYAAEVLVHAHGDFEGVLRYFAALRPAGVVLFSLKDPVDEGRELGTAVSKETVAEMVLASRAFLRDPSLDYFKTIRRRVRRRLERRLYCIRFDHDSLSEDTLWGELKKSARQVVRHVEAQGFAVARVAASSDGSTKSAIMLFPEFEKLPELEERVGPGVELAREVERFVSKNAKIAELVWAGDDGKVHIMQRRRHTELLPLLQEICGPGIDLVGASREVASAIRRNGRVLAGDGIRVEAVTEGWFKKGVEEIIADTIGTNQAS